MGHRVIVGVLMSGSGNQIGDVWEGNNGMNTSEEPAGDAMATRYVVILVVVL